MTADERSTQLQIYLLVNSAFNEKNTLMQKQQTWKYVQRLA